MTNQKKLERAITYVADLSKACRLASKGNLSLQDKLEKLHAEKLLREAWVLMQKTWYEI